MEERKDLNEKEVVEVEVVDEQKESEVVNTEHTNEVEVSETTANNETVVEEVIEPGVTRDMTINYETYLEFFNRNGIKRQLQTTGIICAMMIVVLYLFKSEETTIPQFLVQVAIYLGAVLVVTIGFNFLSTKALIKRNYEKSGLSSVVITVTFNNQGVVQQINGQTLITRWEELMSLEETDLSLFFVSSGRRAIILSKDKLQFGDIEFVRGLVQSHLGEQGYKFTPSKKKKSKIDNEIR